MGYFAALAVDVEEALFEGATPEQIATKFNISVEQVNAYIEQLEEADRDPYEEDYDGQPDEAQEWHDFDPDC